MDRMTSFLKSMGLEPGGIAPRIACPFCNDTGLVPYGDRYRVCTCAMEKELERCKKQAGITRHLATMTFENFDYAYYDDKKRTQGGLTYREGIRRIVEAAKGFVDDVADDKAVEGLLFQGNVGAGKTYLAACIANALIEAGCKPLFIVVPDFLDEIRSTYKEKGDETEWALMERVKKAQVLILDDLGVHNYTEWAMRTLFSIINYRINRDLPMVITTNLSEEERETLLGSRIGSRLMEACRHYRVNSGRDIRQAIRLRESQKRGG